MFSPMRRTNVWLVPVLVWKRKLDHIDPLPLCARSVIRQSLEQEPLIRAECPQRELRGTITRFNQAGVTHFCDVFVVLVQSDDVEREIGLLILYFERTGVNMNLNFLRSQAGF